MGCSASSTKQSEAQESKQITKSNEPSAESASDTVKAHTSTSSDPLSSSSAVALPTGPSATASPSTVFYDSSRPVTSSRSDLPVGSLVELDSDDLGVAEKPDKVKIAQWSPDKIVPSHPISPVKEDQETAEIEEIQMELQESNQVEINKIQPEIKVQSESTSEVLERKEENKERESEQSADSTPLLNVLIMAPLKVSRGLSTRSLASPVKSSILSDSSDPISPKPLVGSPVVSSPSQIFAFDFSRSLEFIRTQLNKQTMDTTILIGSRIADFVSSVQSEWSEFDLDLLGRIDRQECFRSAWVKVGREVEKFPQEWEKLENDEEIKKKAEIIQKEAIGEVEREEDEEDENEEENPIAHSPAVRSIDFWHFVNRKLREEEYQILIEPPNETWAKPSRKR